jgi:predicted YcjX-like family ATPase
MALNDYLEEARLAGRALADYGSGLLRPTLRLGVTGLSRSGKTIFITALIHALLHGTRLPVFEALTSGRIARVRLSPQPDAAIPRFEYEKHLRDLVEHRRWPDSTRAISEIRIEIDYQTKRGAEKTLTLDIVDYPGEWLLDLLLLDKTYEEWSAQAIALSNEGPRAALANQWHIHLKSLNAKAPANEQHAINAAKLFTEYLIACRDERFAMNLLPPGRFLMPGDLAGSPAVTFAPLELPRGEEAPAGSLWAMMAARYEAYRSNVVRPFFREHFARLDRQIVLADVLSAINSGPEALSDLEQTLSAITASFNTGRRTILSSIFKPRADKILFAATKADHLHHLQHDRLENILARMVKRAAQRSELAGAKTDAIAIAAVRATREAVVTRGSEKLPAIVGTPLAGERIGNETFDGSRETAIFPGDLPELIEGENNAWKFRGLASNAHDESDFRFLKFRPPLVEAAAGAEPALPHIRLDRALQFLIGDRLQ